MITCCYIDTIDDNESTGFRDAKFDHLMDGRAEPSEYLQQIGRDECLELFEEYNQIDGKIRY